MTGLDALATRAAGLAPGGRAVLGICGGPGAGKSTLARSLVAELEARGTAAAYLPMDGFHLPAAMLEARGLAGRKGAPETFDVDAYVALLREVRDARDDVRAPDYDRALHDVVPDALVIGASARVVVTEGNYLGLAAGGWERVRPELDELWLIDVPWEVARERLGARRVATGRARDAAEAWVDTVDAVNARLVESARARADLVIPG
ncbi:nucleoside/nucleotide kinase family protein [Demequina mangrovi]|uniref:Phosphoribulokinase / Uridine kinase family protein n=1 Tax=Demequina mangrovi TaxID=1043493 RepID=A0A1H6VBJ6_9MICO|nr:nucleoside/nucleotide kinase family protein [Demequina mangrovi]SEJ00354.1 Phosphoribulokinase / Uridine kinase family protein [Demequina mangrovi]